MSKCSPQCSSILFLISLELPRGQSAKDWFNDHHITPLFWVLLWLYKLHGWGRQGKGRVSPCPFVVKNQSSGEERSTERSTGAMLEPWASVQFINCLLAILAHMQNPSLPPLAWTVSPTVSIILFSLSIFDAGFKTLSLHCCTYLYHHHDTHSARAPYDAYWITGYVCYCNQLMLILLFYYLLLSILFMWIMNKIILFMLSV